MILPFMRTSSCVPVVVLTGNITKKRNRVSVNSDVDVFSSIIPVFISSLENVPDACPVPKKVKMLIRPEQYKGLTVDVQGGEQESMPTPEWMTDEVEKTYGETLPDTREGRLDFLKSADFTSFLMNEENDDVPLNNMFLPPSITD